MVWNMQDEPPRKMASETISAMQEFSNASVVTVEEFISKLERKEAQTKELQEQKVNLEATLAQRSRTMKTQFDSCMEEEKACHVKELEYVKMAS